MQIKLECSHKEECSDVLCTHKVNHRQRYKEIEPTCINNTHLCGVVHKRVNCVLTIINEEGK
jgi:hypothetical protein